MSHKEIEEDMRRATTRDRFDEMAEETLCDCDRLKGAHLISCSTVLVAVSAVAALLRKVAQEEYERGRSDKLKEVEEFYDDGER